jgi:hypothetical protein
LLKGQAIGASAVKQLIGRLRTPDGLNQINNILRIEGRFENVFITPIAGIRLEIAVSDRPIPIRQDILADLIREFALAHLGNAEVAVVTHLSDLPHEMASAAPMPPRNKDRT